MIKPYDYSGHLLSNPPKWLINEPNKITTNYIIVVSSDKVGK